MQLLRRLGFAVGGDDLGAALALGFGLLAIARRISSGSSMSLISTADTLTPQASVASSMMLLQRLADLLALGEDLVELVLAEDVAQRGLRDTATWPSCGWRS